MLKEINSVEELMMLPKGTHVLNRYRPPENVRRQYGRDDEDWIETVFRLTFRKGGLPHLLGHLGTCHKVRENEFTEDNRYFVEVN